MAQGQNTPTSSRDRLTQRISAVTMAHVDAFATDTISNESGLLYNGILEKYQNDPNRTYIRHRPAVNIAFPDSVGDGKGRGVYWWSANSTRYFMNDDVIYKGSYAAPCSMYNGGTPDTAIVSGASKVYFAEWSSANEDYLFIIDPENNDIFCIASAADTTVINIGDRTSGTGAPFHASDSWDFTDLNAFLGDSNLADGLAVLDTYLFLGLLDGKIINSNVDDWLNWNASNFTTAERSQDQLLYLGKQQDHVVAMGGQSIEFFYDNANATGSPLSNRTDIAHREGLSFGQAVWEKGDTIFFQAIDSGGDFYMASLVNFQVTHFNNPTMQSYVWLSRYTQDMTAIMSGFSVGGHVYVILTTITTAGAGAYSLVYDATYDAWYQWETTCNSNTEFQVIGFMLRAATNDNRPQAILRSGDICYIQDDFLPTDDVDGGASVNITLKSIVDSFDANTTETKFMHSINYVGNRVASAQNLTVEYSDDNGATWVSRTLDLADKTQINRLGKFDYRKFRFTIVGTQTVRFEGIDVCFTQGDH